MAYEHIRGIIRPDGRLHIEYHVTDEVDPGQIITDDDLSGKTDLEINAIIQQRYALYGNSDHPAIPIDRAWYERTLAERQQA
jgi:hypothetical protein